jgi:hypothetical protein
VIALKAQKMLEDEIIPAVKKKAAGSLGPSLAAAIASNANQTTGTSTTGACVPAAIDAANRANRGTFLWLQTNFALLEEEIAARDKQQTRQEVVAMLRADFDGEERARILQEAGIL